MPSKTRDKLVVDIKDLAKKIRAAVRFANKLPRLVYNVMRKLSALAEQRLILDALTGRPGVRIDSGRLILSLKNKTLFAKDKSSILVTSDHPGIRVHMHGGRIVPRIKRALAIPVGSSYAAELRYGKPISPLLKLVKGHSGAVLVDDRGSSNDLLAQPQAVGTVTHFLRKHVFVPKRIDYEGISRDFTMDTVAPAMVSDLVKRVWRG